MQWNDNMDEAPRDGTAVLLYAGLKSWTDEMVPVTGWYALGSGRWVSHADWINPTHWMPLPEPPTP